MRESCFDCARKHLAQALVLANEAMMGYPVHRWLAIGHLAEASDELIKLHPQLAHMIRTERIRYTKEREYALPVVRLIEEINAYESLVTKKT
jgi:hypothetical protein